MKKIYYRLSAIAYWSADILIALVIVATYVHMLSPITPTPLFWGVFLVLLLIPIILLAATAILERKLFQKGEDRQFPRYVIVARRVTRIVIILVPVACLAAAVIRFRLENM